MATILTKDPIASLDGDERLYGVDDPAGTPADGTVTPEVLRTYMQANWTLTVDLTADVTGVLPIANGGTGASTASGARAALGVDAAGTDNSTPVTLAGSLDYLTLSGQEITRGPIDLATDTTGTLGTASGGTGQTSLGAVDAADLGSGAATDGHVLAADGLGGAAWEAVSGGSGDFLANGTVDMTGTFGTDVGAFRSDVADGASAVGFDFNTSNTIAAAGGLLQRWRNNGVVKAYIDKDGVFWIPGSFSTSGSKILSGASLNLQAGAGGVGLIANGQSLSWSAASLRPASWTLAWEVGGGGAASDQAVGDLTISGRSAYSSATINLDGGNLILNGGDGASSSAGNADGGDVTISGGTGYGTGSDGSIVLGTTNANVIKSQIPDGASAIGFDFDTANTLSTSGAKLANWSNGGTDQVWFDKDGNLQGSELSILFGASEATTYKMSKAGSTFSLVGGATNRVLTIGPASNIGVGVYGASGSTSVVEFPNHTNGAVNYLRTASKGTADQQVSETQILGHDAGTTATVNTTGGDLTIKAGNGPSSANGNGGDLNLGGGTGYGTGEDGLVNLTTVARVSASSTVANLPGTPAVGMVARVTDANSPSVGSTVSGGGAAAALVWYNGSNWTVIGI